MSRFCPCHAILMSGSLRGNVRVMSVSCHYLVSNKSGICLGQIYQSKILWFISHMQKFSSECQDIFCHILRGLGDWKAFQSCFCSNPNCIIIFKLSESYCSSPILRCQTVFLACTWYFYCLAYHSLQPLLFKETAM